MWGAALALERSRCPLNQPPERFVSSAAVASLVFAREEAQVVFFSSCQFPTCGVAFGSIAFCRRPGVSFFVVILLGLSLRVIAHRVTYLPGSWEARMSLQIGCEWPNGSTLF